MTVPVWAWAVFLASVVAMLALDILVLHRRAHEVSLREAGIWSAVWIGIGLGFGGLVWAWAGCQHRFSTVPPCARSPPQPVDRHHLRRQGCTVWTVSRVTCGSGRPTAPVPAGAQSRSASPTARLPR